MRDDDEVDRGLDLHQRDVALRDLLVVRMSCSTRSTVPSTMRPTHMPHEPIRQPNGNETPLARAALRMSWSSWHWNVALSFMLGMCP